MMWCHVHNITFDDLIHAVFYLFGKRILTFLNYSCETLYFILVDMGDIIFFLATVEEK